jgi:hypothetical protein
VLFVVISVLVWALDGGRKKSRSSSSSSVITHIEELLVGRSGLERTRHRIATFSHRSAQRI